MKIKAEVSENSQLTHPSAFSLPQISNLIIYSNIVVGFCTASAAAAPFLINKVDLSPSCLLFIFCSTVFIYNMDRIKSADEDSVNSPQRIHWVLKNISFLKSINSILLATSLILLLSNRQISTFLIAATLLVLCFLYNGKLKKLPAMKNLLVALVWATTVSILPCFWIGSEINFQYSILAFSIAFVNTIIFDLRDIEGDSQQGIQSIPVILNIDKSKTLLKLLCLGILLITIYWQMFFVSLIPVSYLFLVNWKESKFKYLSADLVLALPVLTYLY